MTPSAALALLDQVEGAGGNAQIIAAPGDLSSSLSALIASLAGAPGSEGDCGPIVVHDETSGVQGIADPNAQSDALGSAILLPRHWRCSTPSPTRVSMPTPPVWTMAPSALPAAASMSRRSR